MMNLSDVAVSIIIMAVVTLFTRAFPFLFFKNRKPPQIIIFIEKYIPPMIMLILVIYCLKDVHWKDLPYGLPEIISLAVVFILHVWKKNPLISIFGGTFLYMALIQTNILEKWLGG